MRIRKLILKLHLYLGLTTGLVILLVSLSGAIYCFAPELEVLSQPYRTIARHSGATLPPSRLLEIADDAVPGKIPTRIYYRGENRSIEIVYFNGKRAETAVYLHPQSGELLMVKSMRGDFFQQLFYFHRSLLLPGGEKIVASACLVFLVLVITGIYLWWPRNRAAKKQRFRIKWDGSPKRLQYDLHSVIGFYTSWFALVFIVTGLIFSFQWFSGAIYAATGSARSVIRAKAPLADKRACAAADPGSLKRSLDKVFSLLSSEGASHYRQSILILPADSTGTILWRANPDQKLLYRSDFRYFNPCTGEEFKGDYVWGRYRSAKTTADKIRRINYDVHTGAIGGLPGRILACLAALLIATMPVTGFLLWKKGSRNIGV